MTIFSRKESTWDNLISVMALRIAKWASTKKKCSDLKVKNFLQNLECLFEDRNLKDEEKVFWCSPPFGFLLSGNKTALVNWGWLVLAEF